ncbi:MAG: hypothetical protein KME33_09475 [Aetokthonos hydrillicola CCALA 1050]|jgi:hypothetical protein|nr:hypothetical protein [Aetokthonos hydrillicola CCALA 1050]
MGNGQWAMGMGHGAWGMGHGVEFPVAFNEFLCGNFAPNSLVQSGVNKAATAKSQKL